MRVLMLSDHCCARVIKQGLALKKRGVEVHYMQRRLSQPAFLPSMDFVGEFIDDNHLRQRLSTLTGYDLIHAHNEPDKIGVIAKQVRPDIKVVFDAHDLFSVRIGVVYPDESDVFTKCDGFVFPSEGYLKHANETHPQLKGKPSTVVYSMPNEDFITDTPPAILNSVAYEGGLRVPEQGNFPEEFKYHSYRDFREVFTKIANKFKIPMVVIPANPDAFESHAGTGALMIPTMEYANLMNTLPMFKWGLVGGPKPGIKQWDTAMPNKLFEFITAGVPIIACNAVEVQDFVEKWEVGVSIDSYDDVPKIFEDADKYRRNIWFLQNKFTMENEIGKVVSLYREVLK